jgi:DNA-binding transcriptional ArsR family regulator
MAKYSDGLDELASALAHSGRRHIVDRLRAGPATTSELAGLLEVGLPAVTKHLGLLADAGLTRSTKSGRIVTHRLAPERLADYSTWLATRESFWHHQLDELTNYLESP